MRAPKKNENVARLPPDEQISYLVHHYEGFADWRINVDEKLEKVDALDGKVNALAMDVTSLRSEVRESTQLGRDNNLLLREVMLYLKGQQTPGLERPGVADDLKAYAEDIAKLKKDCAENESFRARIGYTIAGATGAGILGAWKWWPTITKLLALLNAH